MKKLPIELLTTASANARAGSPVIWDGQNIVLVTDEELNLNAIQRTLSSLVRTNSENSATVVSLAQDVGRLAPSVQSLNTLLPQITQRLASIDTVMSSPTGVTVRLASAEERLNAISRDLNNVLQGGGGSGGGGGGLSSDWSNILSALASGSYLVGEGGIQVERVSSGGAAGQYRIKLATQQSSVYIGAAADFITVTGGNGSFNIGVNATKFSNYVTATAGLKVDTRETDRVVIRPDRSLIRTTDSKLRVDFNEVSGQFTITTVSDTGGTSSGGSVSIDPKTMVKLTTGEIGVATNLLRSPVGDMSYLSAKFDDLKTAAASSRFSGISEADFLQRLSTKGIASKSAAIANSGFSAALKTYVFNSANAALLTGKVYLLKDFNVSTSTVEFNSNGAVIDTSATFKNCVYDFDLKLRVENTVYPPTRFGSGLPLNVEALMIPFAIYALENVSTGQVCAVKGDVLRYGSVSASGNGGQFELSSKQVFDNADLAANNLVPGLYKVTTFIGVKVGSTADQTFATTVINKYALEPSFKATLAFM